MTASSPASARVLAAASIAFGAFIVVTSTVGIVLGVLAYNGWLAIMYGLLGVTMGVAGIAGVWAKGPIRGALFGWFLIGLAGRAILEGDVYLWFISFPIAAILIAGLVHELRRRPSVAATLCAAGGGALTVLSLVALAYAAPHLPVICPNTHALGSPEALLSYPSSTFPWDATEQGYTLQCLEARAR